MAPPIAGDLTYQYLTTNRRTDRPLAVLLDRALARPPACGPLPNTVVCLCLSCDSLSAVDRTGREPAHAPCVHSFDLTKLDSPPRGDVRVSRRAHTPSWVYRRRLLPAALRAAPLTHSQATSASERRCSSPRRNFALLLSLNRVMVMDDAWSLGLSTQGLVDATPGGQSKCPNKSAQSPMECYFKPISRCSLADALQWRASSPCISCYATRTPPSVCATSLPSAPESLHARPIEASWFVCASQV